MYHVILSTQWIMINTSTQPSIKSELKNISKLHFISKQLTHKLERHKLLLHNIIVLSKLKGSCCLCLLMVGKLLPWMYQILQRTEMDSFSKHLVLRKEQTLAFSLFCCLLLFYYVILSCAWKFTDPACMKMQSA